MSFKLVADSGCDLNPELRKELNLTKVPLTIYIDDQEIKDDDRLDLAELLRLMKASPNSPKSASPSPYDFLQAFEGEEEEVYAVTLTSQLSGTYNNAVMAKDLAQEKGLAKRIHIFDSKSASVGQTLVALKILELARAKYEHLEIIERVNNYIKEMKTFFLLESLDNLVKAGRVSKVIGKLSSVLSIKLIMGSTDEGTIKLVEKVRGAKRAFERFIEIIGEQGEKLEEKVLGIAHCNALDKAEKFKKEVLKRYNFKDVIIVEMSGLASIYANEGGIVVSF